MLKIVIIRIRFLVYVAQLCIQKENEEALCLHEDEDSEGDEDEDEHEDLEEASRMPNSKGVLYLEEGQT